MTLFPDYKSKRVMLIDETIIDQFITSRILAAAGFSNSLSLYGCPLEAINALKSCCDKTEFPEIIFIDPQVHAEMGFNFLDNFKQISPEIAGDCKIIFLSASSDKKEIAKAVSCDGVDKVLMKPLTVEMIRDLGAEFGG
jgi:CheY-like chemotaxis protein